MRRVPVFIYIFSVLGLILGVWMIAEGLTYRFSGIFLSSDTLWINMIDLPGFNQAGLPFLLVWLGSTWIGALCAVWVRSSWAYYAALGVSTLSLMFAGIGTILAAVALLCIIQKSTRDWINGNERTELRI